MSCPHCGGSAKFVGYRKKTLTTLLGRIVYQRPYYHCRSCQSGWFPTDEEFGLEEDLTPAAREVVSLAGLREAFDDAAQKSLPKMAGLRISPATVRRVTEGVGREIRSRRERGETFGGQRPWKWHTDRQGQRCAYLSLDATGVPQQAPDGGKADGRMPWVAEVFNPPPAQEKRRQRIWDARYCSGLMSLPEIGRQLRAEALAVGAHDADLFIGLTDGGNGLEDCLLYEVFAGLGKPMQLILDFYHVAEKVHGFAEMWACGPSETRTQADAWCHKLKHEGGQVLLEELEALDLTGRDDSLREAHRLLTDHLRRNLHRTDYPRYLARGWQIGSGCIEAACKTVVNARLAGTGMRWSEHGTDELCHVRALYKSEPSAWQDYWSRSPTAKAA